MHISQRGKPECLIIIGLQTAQVILRDSGECGYKCKIHISEPWILATLVKVPSDGLT